MTEAASTGVVKTPVTMTDGRTVEFSTKQKLSKESAINEDSGEVTVRLDFRNGETRSFTIPSALILKFAAHGAEQKLGDAIAGETDPDDQVVSVDDLMKQLNDGNWTIKRAAGTFAGTSVLVRALVEVSGKSPETIKTYLESKTQAEKLALRRSDQLRPVVERLEAEKASKSKTPAVDTSALLGELDALGSDAPAPSGKKSKAFEAASDLPTL